MSLTRGRSLIAFGTLSLLLLALQAWISTFVEASPRPGILAIAIAADLAIGIPLLYYLLVARRKFLPLSGIVPVFIFTVLAIRFILPPSQQSYLRYGDFLILAVELSVTVFVAFKLRDIVREVRSSRHDSIYFIDALRTGLRTSFRNDSLAAILATEVSVLYLAFVGWFASFRTSRRGVSVHEYHRNSSFGFLLWPLIVLVLIETSLLHLVIGIWTQTGAWILTAINVYTVLWMVGHFHAARLQPIVVTDNYIYLRTGVIWRSRVTLSNIAELRKPTPADSKTPGYANLSLIGSPDIVVVLDEAHEVEGLFAKKKEVSLIGISMDDTGAFLEDVGSRLPSRPPTL